MYNSPTGWHACTMTPTNHTMLRQEPICCEKHFITHYSKYHSFQRAVQSPCSTLHSSWRRQWRAEALAQLLFSITTHAHENTNLELLRGTESARLAMYRNLYSVLRANVKTSSERCATIAGRKEGVLGFPGNVSLDSTGVQCGVIFGVYESTLRLDHFPYLTLQASSSPSIQHAPILPLRIVI
jgi:hypothetical protein